MKRVQGRLSIKRAYGNIKSDNESKIPLSGDFFSEHSPDAAHIFLYMLPLWLY